MRQLNIRIPEELAAGLQAFVDETGEKQSVVVRRGIELAIGQQAGTDRKSSSGSTSSAAESPAVAPAAKAVKFAAPTEDREGGDTGSSTDARDGGEIVELVKAMNATREARIENGKQTKVDFARWLADTAGIPKAIAKRRISEGRVEVDGRARHCDLIEEKDLRRVTLDGNPL